MSTVNFFCFSLLKNRKTRFIQVALFYMQTFLQRKRTRLSSICMSKSIMANFSKAFNFISKPSTSKPENSATFTTCVEEVLDNKDSSIKQDINDDQSNENPKMNFKFENKCKCQPSCCIYGKGHCIMKCLCYQNGYSFRASKPFDEVRSEEYDQVMEEYLQTNADNDFDFSSLGNISEDEDKQRYYFTVFQKCSFILNNSDGSKKEICDCNKCLTKLKQVFKNAFPELQTDREDNFDLGANFFECSGEDEVSSSNKNNRECKLISSSSNANSNKEKNVNNLPQKKAQKTRSLLRPESSIQPKRPRLKASKVVTISLACKMASCLSSFPDESELAVHMFTEHNLLPFKCWAGCENVYFSSR